MKKTALALILFGATMTSASVHAFNLQDLFGSAGSAVSGVVEGLFTKENIEVSEMAGTWTATGSAVTFQSENALKKAGGSAIAGTIESKLDPYYQQYGLIGSTITIDKDGNFELKVKSMGIKGQITKNSDGTFNFTFTPFGSIKLGSVKTFVQKTPSGLDIMFDAKKLKNILSAVAGFTGNSLAKTASSLLDSYEGLCVGFKYKGTASNNGSGNSNGSGSGLLNGLPNIFGGSGNSNSDNNTNQNNTDQNNTNQNQNNTNNNENSNGTLNKAANALKGLFGF